MPNTKKAFKRMRQAEKRRRRNMQVRTRIKHVRAQILKGAATPEEAMELYRTYCSLLDKAAKRGIIKKNTANRRKHRAAIRLFGKGGSGSTTTAAQGAGSASSPAS